MKPVITAAFCLLVAMTACAEKSGTQSGDTAGLLALLSLCDPTAVEAPIDRNGYPLLAGMNIGKTYYDDPCYRANLARLDLVILGFYKDWGDGPSAIQAVLQNIKAINPQIRIGQYSVLTEMYDNDYEPIAEIRAKLYSEDWWLLNAAGEKVQWTSAYDTWEVNITGFTDIDAGGYRYPEWFAHWMHDNFFSPVPEFDIWYFDNVFPKPRVTADYTRDGVNEAPDDIQVAYREGAVSEWAEARTLVPAAITFIGNVSDLTSAEYTKQLDGGFLEALMGESYSIETLGSWDTMMNYYRSAMEHVKDDTLVIFNVHGSARDYRLMRYGLCSCLLGNGHFSYSNIHDGYSSVLWFDEYNISLGNPVDPPPTDAYYSNGVYRRRFDNGMVLVNPKGNGRQTVTVESGYRRIQGTQSSLVNSGEPAADVTLNERDGIILLKI